MFHYDLLRCIQKNKKGPGIVALIFGIAFLISGCKSSELKALENSASLMELQTGREVNRFTQDNDVVLGKPVYAQLRIDFEPVDNHTQKEVYDEIVEFLEKNKWKSDEWNTVPDYFSASLQQDRFTMFAAVLIHLDKNLVTIYMEAR